jgi:hypothetical protein
MRNAYQRWRIQRLGASGALRKPTEDIIQGASKDQKLYLIFVPFCRAQPTLIIISGKRQQMKFLFAITACAILFVASANAQSTRTFHSESVVLDNGGGTTDTVQFTGTSSRSLDVSGIYTNSGNLTLNTTFDANNNNIINGGSGSFTNLATNGKITANVTQIGPVPIYFIGETECLIVNNDPFPFPLLIIPQSATEKGRILVFENPSTAPSPILIAEGFAGDQINFSSGFYQLNTGTAVTLMSDGAGNWLKTN